jgi:hypothetical protein
MTKLLKHSLLGAAAVIAISGFAGHAHAGPITTDINGVVFTWDPSSIAGTPATATQFTADTINYTDYANATINNATGAFSESGVLDVTTFTNKGVPTAGPQLQGYGIYFTYSASGTGSFDSSGNYTGSISSATFNMYIDPNNKDTISNSGSVGPHTLTDGGATDVLLATGGLTNGPNPNQVTIKSGIPNASANTSFDALVASFFVDPTAADYLLLNIVQSSTFTNSVPTENVAACDIGGGPGSGTCVDIHGGDGDATFAVPEPATLSIFGAALVGLGFAKRRKNQKTA